MADSTFEEMLGVEPEVKNTPAATQPTSDISFEDMLGGIETKSDVPSAPDEPTPASSVKPTPPLKPTDIPESTPETEDPMFKKIFNFTARRAGLLPAESVDELGRPVKREEVGTPQNKEKLADTLTKSLGHVKTLATNPYETLKGSVDFALSTPGFLVGLIDAGTSVIGAIADRIIFGGELTINDLYDIASEKMEKSMEFFQPGKEMILGKPTEESQLVGQMAMSPVTMVSGAFHEVANQPWYKDHPNIQGTLKFMGDVAGLMAMGVIVHGVKGKEYIGRMEDVANEAVEIVKTEQSLDSIPNDTVREIQKKILEVKKSRLEAKAAKIAKDLETDTLVKEELARKAEEVAKAKTMPVEKTGLKKPKKVAKLKETEAEKPKAKESKIKEPVEEPKPKKLDAAEMSDTLDEIHNLEDRMEDYSDRLVEETDEARINVLTDAYNTALEKYNKLNAKLKQSIEAVEPKKTIKKGTAKREEIAANLIANRLDIEYEGRSELGHTWTVEEEGKTLSFTTENLDFRVIEERLYNVLDENESRIKEISGEREVETDLDYQTGTREPVRLGTEESPFREDPTVTKQRTKMYEGRKGVMEDPELFTHKLINDVNRWLDGENVPIDQIRDGLSNLAERADSRDVSDYFRPGDPKGFENWKDMVKEAASWARRAKRPTKGMQLNMMIPLDKVPHAVSSLISEGKGVLKKLSEKLKDNRLTVGDVARNKKIFDETGFWYGKDGKWRYEIDDTKATYYAPQEARILKEGDHPVARHLTDVLDYPELYEAVPEMKEMSVVYNPGHDTPASFSGYTKSIILKKWKDKSSLIHELQHAVNSYTGAFRGSSVRSERTKLVNKVLDGIYKNIEHPEIKSQLKDIRRAASNGINVKSSLKALVKNAREISPKDAREMTKFFGIGNDVALFQYITNPGEMEARLSEARMSMTKAERRRVPPWKTLDDMLRSEYIISEKEYKSKTGPGFKLYSAEGAAIEGAKQIVKGARRAKDYIIYARGMKSFKPVEAAKLFKKSANRSLIDKSGNIRVEMLDKASDLGYEIVQKMVLSKGASSISSLKLKQMQKEIYSGLSRNEKRILDTLIFHTRMTDIGKYKSPKEFQFFKDHPVDESIAYLGLFDKIEKLTPEIAADLQARAAGYFEWMKKPLKDMLDSGLISTEEFDRLSSHNYRKLKLVDIFDKRYQTKVGKRKRTVYDSGIESLSRGRDTDIFEPSSEIMALEVFNRAYGRIMNNEANKTLLELAKRDPKNPFVRVKSKEHKIPSGWDRVFVYKDGTRKSIYLSPDMSKEWILNNPEMSYKMSQILRFASGSAVLRTFATGVNWGFALANLPRDVMHTWFSARAWENGKWKSVYSPHLPVYSLQIGRDLMTVFLDAALRKGRYEDYINEGGGMEFMVHQGRLLKRGRHLEGPIDKVNNLFGYFGEVSESMTRLAIRERAMRKGLSSQEATFVARDYMDFSQGGGIAKAADNAIPYLNAAIQGTRGLFRSFKPGSGSALSSTYKLAQFAALVTGTYIVMNDRAPETKKNLQGSIDMTNNFVIPLGDEFGFIDNNGQMRYPYVKIPLDPSQRFFKKFFEASTDKWLGNEVDVIGTADALRNLFPVEDVSGLLPPTISGTLGYTTNKDFWRNEDIWKKSDTFGFPNSKEEWTSRTPQVFIDIGQKTGLSPERLKYTVNELTTNGTIWSYLLGQGYDAVFKDLPKEKKEQHLAMVLARTPAFKRFIGVTNPYSKHATKFDKAQEEAVLKEFVENRNFDIKVEGFLYGEKGQVSRKDVIKEANQYNDRDTYKRLMDRFKFEEAIKELPEKSFWRRMKGLRMEAKVSMFVDRLSTASMEEKEQLWKEYGIISRAKGVISPEFRQEVGKRVSELK